MNFVSKQSLWMILLPVLWIGTACQNHHDAAPETPESAPAATPVASNVQNQPRTRFNLNTATREEFLTVPNVGDRMVREFFEYRPYVSIRQFRREIGKYVDEAQVAAYEQYVYVPVDPNESDAETLQQLPGVNADLAAELIAGRPYASHEAFLEKLAAHVTAEQRTEAAAYLNIPHEGQNH